MQCRVRVGLFCSLLCPATGPSLVLNKSLQNSKGGGGSMPAFSPWHPQAPMSELLREDFWRLSPFKAALTSLCRPSH